MSKVFSDLFSKKFTSIFGVLSILGYGIFVFASELFAPVTILDPAYSLTDPTCIVSQTWE